MKGMTQGVMAALILMGGMVACGDHRTSKVHDYKNWDDSSETETSTVLGPQSTPVQTFVVESEPAVDASVPPPVVGDGFSVWWPPAFFDGPIGGDDEEYYGDEGGDDEDEGNDEEQPKPCKPDNSRAGTLDPSFNPYGVEPGTVGTVVANAVDNYGAGVAIQPNGDIVIAGNSNVDGISEFSVARFLPDGSLDPSFNSVPVVLPGTTFAPSIGGYTNENDGGGVALQPDGKIVVAGSAVIGGVYQFAVARFNYDGSLDASFNAAGDQPGTTYIIGINNYNLNNYGQNVALQKDGKIVVVGYTSDTIDTNQFAVARFNSNGTLDTTFNASGVQPGTAANTIDGVDLDNEAYSLVIKSDGKILLGGFAVGSDVVYQFALAQYNSNGTLDTGFNANGLQAGTASTTIDNSLVASFGYSVALQKDGKIVMGGNVGELPGLTVEFALARFYPNGTLDTSFNPQGIQPGTVSVAVNNFTQPDVPSDLAIQDNGKIIVGGAASNGTLALFAVARFLPNGTLDTEFDAMGSQPGVVTTSVDNSNYSISDTIALQKDGKIILGGYAATVNGYEFALARLFGDQVGPCNPH